MAKTKKLAMFIIALVLLVCSSFALSGCDDSSYYNDNQQSEAEESQQIEEPTYTKEDDVPVISGYEFIGKTRLLYETHAGCSDVAQYLVYDPDTMVEYTFLYSGGQANGLTVLLNADGTPKLYSPDKE